jgi:hypothetical protein
MRFWTLLLLVMAAVIGSAQTSANSENTKPEPSSGKSTVVKLPVNAVRISDGLYRFTDPDGKVWLYRRTPFGYARSEEGLVKDSAAAGADTSQRTAGTPFGGAKSTGNDRSSGKGASSSVEITATEEGDNIRFERPTPFGKTQWVKPKAELNAEETRIWETQRNKPSEPDSK